MKHFSRRGAIGSVLAAGILSGTPALARTPETSTQRLTSAGPLLDYLRANGPLLLRKAQGLFRYPSIAPSLPGKQYAAELWDWDTMWTTRGLFRLAQLTKDRAFHRTLVDHAKGSLLNFLDHQSPEGRLPIVMASTDRDGNRFPFTARDRNQAKPVMAQLALLVADQTGDAEWCRPVFDKLLRFHDSWLTHNRVPSGLLVWSNDVAIGNDNDPTTFARPPFSSANLLLNCLYHEDLRAASELAKRLGRPQAERDRIAARMDGLAKAIRRECWDPRDEFFYTVDVQVEDRRAELIPNVERGMDTSWSTIPLRLQVFTGFLPLWCGVATREQAAAMIRRNYLADDRLRAAAGVRTLSNRETMYTLAFSSNPSNWLGPVWIISNYFVWKALAAYGYTELADELADKTVKLLVESLRKDGSLNEYYHPDTGQPLSHTGFMNWNMLALEML